MTRLLVVLFWSIGRRLSANDMKQQTDEKTNGGRTQPSESKCRNLFLRCFVISHWSGNAVFFDFAVGDVCGVYGIYKEEAYRRKEGLMKRFLWKKTTNSDMIVIVVAAKIQK